MKTFTVTLSSHTWVTYEHVQASSYDELLTSLEEDGDESVFLKGVYGRDDGDGGDIDIEEEEPVRKPLRNVPIQSRAADRISRQELLKNVREGR